MIDIFEMSKDMISIFQRFCRYILNYSTPPDRFEGLRECRSGPNALIMTMAATHINTTVRA